MNCPLCGSDNIYIFGYIVVIAQPPKIKGEEPRIIRQESDVVWDQDCAASCYDCLWDGHVSELEKNAD